MHVQHEILLIPGKADTERDAVATAWTGAGGTVVRVDRFWERPDLPPEQVALYGPDTFCLVLGQLLGLDLLSPPDDLLLRASPEVTRRAICGVTLAEALDAPFPAFVKPLVPKQFRAGVWQTAEQLQAECRGLAPDSAVITSQVIRIAAEARAWILGGRVLTCAVYEGESDPAEAAGFVEDTVTGLDLPDACVIDAALVDGGWCLLEANAAWGAGLNGCDAAAAVRCIDRAAHHRGAVPQPIRTL